jgi:hypothetical protein
MAKGGTGCFGKIALISFLLLVVIAMSDKSSDKKPPQSTNDVSASPAPVAAQPKTSDRGVPGLRKIKKPSSYGCKDKEYYSKIMGYVVDEDKVAFEKELRRGISTGRCTVFSVGEEVFLNDTAIFSGVVQVRRKGDTDGYWVAIEAIQQ